MIFFFDQLNAQSMLPTFTETLLLRWVRELPTQERGKLLDLLHRFSMARLYTGEIKFDFQWLLEAEKDYEAMVYPEHDALGHFQNALASETKRTARSC